MPENPLSKPSEKEYYLKRLSPAYFEALEDAKRFHAGTSKFSGKFLRPHARHLKRVIERYNIKSILDYGCGKGQQYTWIIPNANIEQWGEGSDLEYGDNLIPHGKTLEQYWGVKVTKFDPAVPAFDQEPEEAHDLVIVSHVLGAIPNEDMGVILERIFSLANTYVYIVEAIGRPKKQWTDMDISIRNTMDWIDLIAPVKPQYIRCELVVRYRSDHGSHIGRFML